MSTSAGKVRKALPAAIVTAIADDTVQVTLGYPWPQNAYDMIGVGAVEATFDPATMGTRRTRDESLSVEVLISVFRPGGQEVEETASDRAYGLLDAIEHHLRMTDPTLGGLVCLRPLLLAAHEMDSAPFDSDTAMGRCVEVSARFTGLTRIAN